MHKRILRPAAAAAALVLLTGCDNEPTALAPVPVENDIVVTLPAGDTVAFQPVVTIFCGDWEPEETPVRAVHVLVGLDPETQVEEPPPLWRVTAAVDAVRGGEPIAFPASWTGGRPPAAQVGVYVPPIDFFTTEPDSDGSITFQSLDCRLGGVVEFSIDASIGAELYLDAAVRMSGTFRGSVGRAPAPF